jgi:protein-S-isoprenylcysteine O-methyltransferase Ste14
MTKTEKTYDVVMRLPVIAFDLFFLVHEILGMRVVVALHPYFGGDWSFLVTLAARVSVVIFLAVSVCFHIARYRPVSKYATWYPKVTALAGMLFANLILLTPRATPDPLWDSASTLLILTGTIISTLVIFDLGRSLSVMPEARKLVTSGFYRYVRHPLYLAAEVGILGIFLQFRSWQGLLILAVHFYFQIRRMDWEEGILAKAFPDYVGYKNGTYRVLPRLY